MSAFSSNWSKLQSQLPTWKKKGASVPKGKRKQPEDVGDTQQLAKKTKRGVETAQA